MSTEEIVQRTRLLDSEIKVRSGWRSTRGLASSFPQPCQLWVAWVVSLLTSTRQAFLAKGYKARFPHVSQNYGDAVFVFSLDLCFSYSCNLFLNSGSLIRKA